MKKRLDDVEEENALMKKELAKHNIVVPSSIKEPEEDEASVEVANLEEKEEQQISEQKMQEEIKVSLLDSESR